MGDEALRLPLGGWIAVRRRDGEEGSRLQQGHLQQVGSAIGGDRASDSVERLAFLLHDLGKRSKSFRKRLRAEVLDQSVMPLKEAAANLEAMVEHGWAFLALVKCSGDRRDRVGSGNRLLIGTLLGFSGRSMIRLDN